MAGSSKGGHLLTTEDNSKGGKNSKRGPSRSTSLLNMLKAKPSKSLIEALRKELNKDGATSGDMLTKKSTATFADLLDITLMYEAISGNVPAHKEINDRCDGKAKQQLEVTGKDDKPLQIIISKDLDGF